MAPDDVIAYVKDSGLRGRGGAGFPTGLKWCSSRSATASRTTSWSTPTSPSPGPARTSRSCSRPAHAHRGRDHHLLRDRLQPRLHLRARRSRPRLRRLLDGRREAYAAGYLGNDILGTGFDLDIIVHAGAGAYICGEETALLDSLEGRRGQPRLQPPFPAVAGLYACPTVVNNVESIASVPSIVCNGADWFSSMGTEKSTGLHALLALRPRHQARPVRGPARHHPARAARHGRRHARGHRLKFWTPGGSSTPLFTDEHLDVPLDYESVGAAGSMLGTRALQIFDETDLRRARRRCAGPSSTRTSPAASAPRAARAPTGWCSAATTRGTARAPRRTSTSCSTSATTSSAARSAPSATARPARSSPRSSTSVTSTCAHFDRAAAAPSTPGSTSAPESHA